MFNIRNCNGRMMLGCNVPTRGEAEKHLLHYTSKVGQPYPNGKGFYPDLKYEVVETDVPGDMEGVNIDYWLVL